MKHQIVDHTTNLKVGDFVIVKGKWAEIYHITQDDGINTSQGWVCRSEIPKWQVNPDLPVYIVCAACRNFDGRIICGPRHMDTIMREQIKAAEGLKHWQHGGCDQGFVDQYGRFYSREEAWIIAEKNGQIRNPNVSTYGTLYSECLY